MNLKNRFTFYSVGLHLCLVLITFLLNRKIHDIKEQNKDFNMKLVQSSVRVDVVSMPKMTFKELQSLEAEVASGNMKEEAKKEAPKEETPAPNEEAFEKVKSQFSFNDMLAKYKGKPEVKVKEKDGKGKGSIDNGLKNSLKDLVLAGNRLSEGSALTGRRGGSGEMANAYLGKLPEHVRPFWKLPSFLLNKDLRCRIRVFLSPNGGILNAVVLESSGDKEYDKRALDAVKASSPFPPLPQELVSSGTKGEIVLGFPL
ncbi:MAG: hypothetical protein Fur0010_27650 [Bdellovibrio sp.]